MRATEPELIEQQRDLLYIAAQAALAALSGEPTVLSPEDSRLCAIDLLEEAIENNPEWAHPSGLLLIQGGNSG
jgi:hypothetical protein